MPFSDLGLSEPILRAIADEGYDAPTAIQKKAIPHVLDGQDLLGCAQTGTGKTAAFALPILDNLWRARRAAAPKPKQGRRKVEVLVLSPTRELASQIGQSFTDYGRHTGLTCSVIFGGVNQNRQVDAIARGVDILVATPGRLLDLMGQGAVSLSDVNVFVLDEADRMLDMGFSHDVKRIAAQVPKQRQTLLFSATMPDSIRALANSLLHEPVEVAVAPIASTADTVEQVLYFVEKADKRPLLGWLLDDSRIDRALVFTRTKHGANRVAEFLEKRGVNAAAIHGNKSQNARERALDGFKAGKIRALVATDIAARGIDIDQLSFVINFDLPNVPEAYVHRIGRTGRAGFSGRAMSFCEAEERPYLSDIERLIQKPIPAVTKHPYPSPLGIPPATDLTPKRSSESRRDPQGSRNQRPARGAQGSGRGARPQRGAQGPSRGGQPPRETQAQSRAEQPQREAQGQRRGEQPRREAQPQTRAGQSPREAQAQQRGGRSQQQRDAQGQQRGAQAQRDPQAQQRGAQAQREALPQRAAQAPRALVGRASPQRGADPRDDARPAQLRQAKA